MKNKGWWVFVLLLSVGLGLFASRRSWESYQSKASESRSVQSRANRIEAELVKAEIEVARASDPVGKERMARKRGYRKPQETPLVLEP